jgi:hypothetical protein
VVAVGTTAGFIFFVDFNKLEQPRIVERIHLHQGPITHLTYVVLLGRGIALLFVCLFVLVIQLVLVILRVLVILLVLVNELCIIMSVTKTCPKWY